MKTANKMLTIPQDWQIKPLREFAYLNKGISYKSEDYSKDESGYIFVNLKCIKKFGGFNPSGIKYFKGFVPINKKLLTDDLLIANTDLTRDGDVIGCPTLLPKLDTNQEITMSMDLSKVEINENLINKNYINFYLTTPTARKFMKDHSSGSTVLHLQTSKVPNMIFILPKSKLEQGKIAKIILTIDEAISNTELLIEKYKSIKQGLMQNLFKYGIDEKGQIRSEKTHKFKNSPLGRIPEEWEVVGLLDTCKLINGRAFKPSEWHDDGLPIIRIENLNDINAPFNYCKAKVLNKNIINNNDLLISWSGTPGTSFGVFLWTRGKAVLNQHIFKVVLNNKIEKQFFYYSYKNLLSEMIRQSHGGVGLQHITKEDLKRLKLVLPKQNEQNLISDKLLQVDHSIIKEEIYCQKLVSLKQGLMQDLLTGKVRVNHLLN